MIKVSAAEFQRNIGKYQDIALREPVEVTRNGREGTVLVSANDFKYMRHSYRRVIGPGDLTDEELDAILKAEIPAEAAAFNDELKD
jgi:prevent-host-death family protein